ncbi:MAG TPA: hypothetical protein VHY09_00225 [Candidatus Methylacidiphilales bacterium]|nr:hypothetical protein [Candidatus Methylacidiphilales bacterium]
MASGATTAYAYYPTSGAGSAGNGPFPNELESVKLVSSGATT